jgi:PAS domain S-box-containing protein
VSSGCKVSKFFCNPTVRIDEAGGVIGFIGINRDISERKRAEKLKREGDERYRRLFESMREVFFVCEIVSNAAGKLVDIRCLDANPACLQRAHRTREEMVGHTYLELFSTNPTFEIWLEKFSRVAHSGTSENFEQFTEATGLYFEVFAFSPHPGQCAVLMNDITARKFAEQTLSDKDAILSTAEEVAQIGSWHWDLRTQKVTWSDEMFRLFGVDREGFDGDVNRVVPERIHPDDAAAVRASNRSVLEDDQPIPLSYRIVLPNGAERAVWAQGKIIRDETGQPIALTGYVQDITERVRAEKQLLQMKRLYATLSQVNQTIVRVKDPAELYQSICDVAVKFGEFSLAWIGLLDEKTGNVNPVSASGMELSEWRFPIVNIHSQDYEQGITVTAIRSSRLVIDEEVQTALQETPLVERLREAGYRSIASARFDCAAGWSAFSCLSPARKACSSLKRKFTCLTKWGWIFPLRST